MQHTVLSLYGTSLRSTYTKSSNGWGNGWSWRAANGTVALFFCTNDPNWPLWICLYGLTCAVFVFLSPPASKPIASSGTISNARQFASWTYYLHKQVNIIDMMTYIGIVFCTFFLARSRCLYRLSTRSTAALCLSGRRGWSLSI